MVMDLEKETIRGRQVLVLLGIVAAFVWFISPYLTRADDMRIHLKAYPAFVIACNKKEAQQDLEIGLLKRDVESGIQHRKRVEAMIKDQVRASKEQNAAIMGHLSRLKLVDSSLSMNKPSKKYTP